MVGIGDSSASLRMTVCRAEGQAQPRYTPHQSLSGQLPLRGSLRQSTMGFFADTQNDIIYLKTQICEQDKESKRRPQGVYTDVHD
ncbi:MAG: hypothetical protein HDQ88_07900 [Clostridia bacterium]|nr:hypothetical protein [Clostridia bacterium]